METTNQEIVMSDFWWYVGTVSLVVEVVVVFGMWIVGMTMLTRLVWKARKR
jgi:hypothetical protein